MIHANLVDGGVFFGVAALTLLLMMFLYAVITADPEEAVRTEAPLMQSAVLPAPALPVRGAQTTPPMFPSEARPGTDYVPTHSAAAVTSPLDVSRRGPAAVISPSEASRRGPAAVISPSEASRRRPAAAFLFLIAGLALTVIGGGMFFGAGQDVTVCANQALAICSDGFVVLHTAQLFGGVLAVGGIAFVSTAIVLALR
jgi:hypothetical protein